MSDASTVAIALPFLSSEKSLHFQAERPNPWRGCSEVGGSIEAGNGNRFDPRGKLITTFCGRRCFHCFDHRCAAIETKTRTGAQRCNFTSLRVRMRSRLIRIAEMTGVQSRGVRPVWRMPWGWAAESQQESGNRFDLRGKLFTTLCGHGRFHHLDDRCAAMERESPRLLLGPCNFAWPTRERITAAIGGASGRRARIQTRRSWLARAKFARSSPPLPWSRSAAPQPPLGQRC